MLHLKNISKRYVTGELVQNALDGVSLSFRDSEFVAILGPSGSGKTTLLNIIGGLDRYDNGDLVINSRSTKGYNDHDWDTYRNHTIGFVFQSYNLIPHQSVLANVELALTVSGVPKGERKKRALDALKQVGLDEHSHKRPNEMSGGQMQRVAIARALVNNPDILLADEPTGALDSDTSVQVMEMLKEISKNRLVIMVTHNSELADNYATRIIKLRDGKAIDDTSPYTPEEYAERIIVPSKKIHKPSMSFFTALSLSLNNLRTKKGRTLLTSFAGSIGIVGIALILALSTGIQNYVESIQRETLASYPITIEREPMDFMNLLISDGQDSDEDDAPRREDAVYSNPMIYNMFNTVFAGNEDENNLDRFKEYLDSRLDPDAEDGLAQYVTSVQYRYDIELNTYITDEFGKYRSTEITDMFEENGESDGGMMSMFSSMRSMMGASSMWTELLPGIDGSLISSLIMEQYDVVYGEWPKNANDIVLVLDSRGEIPDAAFYALGLMSADEVNAIFNSVLKGEEIETQIRVAPFDEIVGTEFKLILNSDYYTKNAFGGWDYVGDDQSKLNVIIGNGISLNVVGIIKPSPDASASSISGMFGYTSALTDYLMQKTNESEIIIEQSLPENQNFDVTTGLPFVITDKIDASDESKAEQVLHYFATLDEISKTEVYTSILSTPSEEYLNEVIGQYLINYPTRESMLELAASTYGFDIETMSAYLIDYSDDELRALMVEQLRGVVSDRYAEQAALQIAQIKNSVYDPEDLFGMKGYIAVAAAFDEYIATLTDTTVLAGYYDSYMPATVSGSTLAETLDKLGVVHKQSPSSINIYASNFENKNKISEIITEYNDSVEEIDRIQYTDYIASMLSGVITMIDAVSYGLIAFVAISLVVSSIMIGIITYISVLERTKEIGILRSIGASKRDISSVFNAETLIVGFFAGAIGILLSMLLCIPLNLIIHSLSGLTAINATLPTSAGLILVLISMVLTLIAGLIPARMAAKKDPVKALRTE